MNVLSAFFAGALFAIGLVVSGMTEPMRIVRFLDVAGDWDPALAFVMGGAILAYAPLYQLITRRVPRPLVAPQFHIPPRGQLDLKLFGGAALFGIGWGLAGLCPGPALVALGAGKPEAAIFCAAMLVGSLAGGWLEKAGKPSTSRLGSPSLLQDDA